MINRYPQESHFVKKTDSSPISTFAPEQPVNEHYAAPPDTAQLAHAVRTASSVACLAWPRFCRTGTLSPSTRKHKNSWATRRRELSFFGRVSPARRGANTSRPPRPTRSEGGGGSTPDSRPDPKKDAESTGFPARSDGLGCHVIKGRGW